MDDEHPLARAASLAAIVESSYDAIVSKDLDGVIRSCNPASERIFGYPADEMIGRNVLMLIPPERHTEEVEILDRIRRGLRTAPYETVRIGKGGRRIEVSLTVSPILDPSGAVIGASKIARDITERKRLERELAEQREQYRVTLSSIGDGVIASATDGTVTFLNRAAEALTGWRTDEAIGHPLEDVFRIINEQTRAPVDNPAQVVMRSGHIVELANHTLLVAKDGTERPIDDSGAPIRSRDGHVVGAVLVFRDVQERRRIEQERRQVAAERERLLEAERVARAEAERTTRAKDDFVAAVSHELRTPLNAILGWTELMLQHRTDQKMIARGLEVVGRNTRLQAQLVSDLLDMSRIVSGKLRLEVVEVDLPALIESVLETVRQSADDKRIEIRQELDAPILPLAGDPARLQQVLWNLLSNAIKFTPPGGTVWLRVTHHDEGATIVVEDTGDGIAPEVLPHVFGRFSQAVPAGRQGAGGLGLGLSIVKHLITLHGGTVHAESPGEGLGASFTVTLPASGAPASPADVDTAPEEATPTDVLQNLHVMVVEDEDDTRDFLERFLTAHGMKVTAVCDGDEALARWSQARPDVLISDIGLPGIDGYEMLQRIRQSDPAFGGGVPAIALTAYARSEDRARAFRAGYQAHLAKPVEPADLVAAVRRIAPTLDR